MIVASFGRRVIVEDADHDRHTCLIKGRRLKPVCGDRVVWEVRRRAHVVTAIETRRNALTRPDRQGRIEVLAANLDQLLVVIAPHPAPDPFITDRYFVAAEHMGIDAVLVYNKVDRGPPDALPWVQEFVALDYEVLTVSAKDGTNLDALRAACRDKTSILVGVSGVGKSSLLNALVPGVSLDTGEVSSATGEGRHTTSASRLHRLPNGGAVIDSPGVRDYAPPSPVRDVAEGFREIGRRAAGCKFNDCLHRNEPDCAVLAALDRGDISARRYESYRRLLHQMAKLDGPETR